MLSRIRLQYFRIRFRKKLRRSDLSIGTIKHVIRSSVGATFRLTGRSYGATNHISGAGTIDRSSLTGLLKHALIKLLIFITFFCLASDFARGQRAETAAQHFNRGIALLEKQNIEGALSEFKLALKLNPRYSEAHNAMGLALARKGDLKLAVESFNKAVEIDPRAYKTHRNIGRAFLQLGDLTHAIEAFKQSISLKPDDAETRVMLGAALQQRGENDAAFQEYREAARLNPNLADAHFYLGYIYGCSRAASRGRR